ncbi:MAG TPA: major capsid family protein [Polyangiaceae bacterium]|jgi:hypothetical protein|nr:major capsid family protein [Polyangiaceae bacterium]
MAFNKHVLLARLFASMMDPGVQQRLDSIGTAVFARQFELIEQEITRTEFSPLKSEEFIPYDTSAPAGTQSITHRTVTQTGNADFVDHYADDLPHADIYAEEFTVKVEDLGVAYFWTVRDVQRAAIDATIRLDAERKQSAIDGMRRKHDQLAALGSLRHGRTGFVNSDLVPIVSAVNGSWSASTDSEKIIEDILKLWTSIPTVTLDVERPDTLILPTAVHSLLASKPYSENHPEKTILKWLEENLDGCKEIGRWERLSNAGIGGTRRIIAYRKAKDVVKYHAPELFAEEPPQRKNLKFVVPCHAQTGFTEIRKPLAVAYMDGV